MWFLDRTRNHHKCSLCSQTFKEPQYGKVEKVEPYKKRPAKKKDHVGDVTKKVKMGFEKQDPRIAQAEGLKKEVRTLQVKIKKGGDAEYIRQMRMTLSLVFNDMKELQETYAEA